MKRPRIWRYRVAEVWGPEPPVKVGDILLDKWSHDRTWQLFDFTTMEEGAGWYARLLGEVTGDDLAKYWAKKESAQSDVPG